MSHSHRPPSAVCRLPSAVRRPPSAVRRLPSAVRRPSCPVKTLKMNFLAHIFLSGEKEHLIVGNFLADYLSNKQVANLPRPVQEGIRLHRKIDSFTDGHELVRESVQKLRPVHRKFAPVVLDICYDYVLAKNWQRYSAVEINEFTLGVYGVLENHLSLMPPFLQDRLPRMIADNWLVKYGTEGGLRFTFERMKARTRYPQYFENAVDNFLKDYGFYENAFNRFFPELVAAVKDWGERSE